MPTRHGVERRAKPELEAGSLFSYARNPFRVTKDVSNLQSVDSVNLVGFEQMEPYRQAKMSRTGKLHRIRCLRRIFPREATGNETSLARGQKGTPSPPRLRRDRLQAMDMSRGSFLPYFGGAWSCRWCFTRIYGMGTSPFPPQHKQELPGHESLHSGHLVSPGCVSSHFRTALSSSVMLRTNVPACTVLV